MKPPLSTGEEEMNGLLETLQSVMDEHCCISGGIIAEKVFRPTDGDEFSMGTFPPSCLRTVGMTGTVDLAALRLAAQQKPDKLLPTLETSESN